jgi:catechol 2,3-dioxygenase-like lactoylglutathione lyase family enzyme
MSKLRHIAIIVEDPEASAKFFEEAFDMKRAGTARRGIYMSDGIFNVALLKKESDKEKLGLYHFGMWVDDLDESRVRPDAHRLGRRGEGRGPGERARTRQVAA